MCIGDFAAGGMDPATWIWGPAVGRIGADAPGVDPAQDILPRGGRDPAGV